MHITMLYGLQGIDYRRDIGGDPYQLDGWEHSPRMRAVLKQAILIAVNASDYRSGLRALRGKLARDTPTFGWVFDEKVRLDSLLQAMIDKHQTIAGSLFNGQGVCLQYLDSQITELLLSRAMEAGVVLLPVHDSYVVDRDHEGFLDQEMDRCFWEIVDRSRGKDYHGIVIIQDGIRVECFI